MASDGKPLAMLDDVSEFEFGSVFDALDVGIVVLDGQGCIVGWNDWIARLTRRSEQSVLGKNLFDIFPSLRDTRLPAVLEESIQVGSSSILTHSLNTLLPLRDEAGQEVLHNIVVRPLASGRATHCLLQINDVTVSVTRERVLRERQNARYHAIVDTAPDAIITTGLDRVIQWLNGAAEHVFGYAPAELLGQKIDILLEQEEILRALSSATAWESRRARSKSSAAASRVNQPISTFHSRAGERTNGCS